MQKTLYVYEITPKIINSNQSKLPTSIELDILEMVHDLCSLEKSARKIDYASDYKILYLDNYEYKESERVLNLCFISAKYNARRHVINTQTIKEKGVLKTVKDGDSEKNHLSIKFYDDEKPICLFESNRDGIGFSKIVDYINACIREKHKGSSNNIRYRLTTKNIVSKDFLKSLEDMKRITAVKLTINREDLSVSDVKALAGRNDLTDNAEIVLKPAARGRSIFSDTVKDFFEMYNNKNTKIKRVTVEGDSNVRQGITFNTEQMKEKISIDVATDIITGEVSTKSIYEGFIEVMEEL